MPESPDIVAVPWSDAACAGEATAGAGVRWPARFGAPRFSRALRVVALYAAALVAVSPAVGSTVRLRIKVVNPRATNQLAVVRANLPPRVTTNDVVSWGGLDWGYDTQNDVFFVHKNVELAPLEGKFYDVEIKDIWSLDTSELNRIRAHVSGLVGKLKGSSANEQAYEQAAELEGLVGKSLQEIEKRQEQFAIGPNVAAIQHINAYETNLGALQRVKKDVGLVENLVLGSGQDIGELIGEAKLLSKPDRPDELSPEQYRTAVIELTVLNPSTAEKKTISIRENLPEEIRVYDVLSADELEVGTDFNTGSCYVYKDGLELAPGQKRVFKISIRDKWDVNQPRVRSLTESASNLLGRVQARGRFPGIEDALGGIIKELAVIGGERGPEKVNDQYVAFFREQAGRVGLAEQRLRRVESALRPIEKTVRIGLKVKPPSAKTTWGLIYIILGFLGFFSVLFFLRWFGKGKSEKMDA